MKKAKFRSDNWVSNINGGYLENENLPFIRLCQNFGTVSIAFYFKHNEKEFGMILDTYERLDVLMKKKKKLRILISAVYESMAGVLIANMEKELKIK